MEVCLRLNVPSGIRLELHPGDSNINFLAYYTVLYLRLWERLELRGVGYAFAINLLHISNYVSFLIWKNLL